MTCLAWGKKSLFSSKEVKPPIYLMTFRLYRGVWMIGRDFSLLGHESNCYEIKCDLTIMSQEVNIICLPDGLEASL